MKKNFIKLTTLFPLLIPSALVFWWHFVNMRYPQGDYAYYFSISQNLYTAMSNGDLLSALMYIPGRPTIFTLLAQPFLIISQGKILLTLMLFQTTMILVLTCSCYYLFRIWLPKMEGIISALLIVSIPWCINSAFYFTAEITLLVFLILAIYFWIKSNDFRIISSMRYFFLFSAFSLCTRPAISFFLLLFPFLYSLINSVKEKRITYTDIALFFIFIFWAALFMYKIGISRNWTLSAYTLIYITFLISIFIIIISKWTNLTTHFWITFFFLYYPTIFWFGPKTDAMLRWIQTGITAPPLYGDARETMPPLYTAIITILHLGTYYLTSLITASLILLAINKIILKKSKLLHDVFKDQKWKLLVVSLIPIVVGSFSQARTYRYYHGCLVVLLIFSILLFWSSINAKKMKRSIFLCLLFPLLFIASYYNFHTIYDDFRDYSLFYKDNTMLDMIFRLPNDHMPENEQKPYRASYPPNTIFDFFQKNQKVFDDKSIGFIPVMPVGNDIYNIIDPHLFNIMSVERGLNIHFSQIDNKLSLSENSKINLAKIRKYFDYLLIGESEPFGPDSIYSNLDNKEPIRNIYNTLIKINKDNPMHGFKLNATFKITMYGSNPANLYLLKSVR